MDTTQEYRDNEQEIQRLLQLYQETLNDLKNTLSPLLLRIDFLRTRNEEIRPTAILNFDGWTQRNSTIIKQQLEEEE